MERAGEDTNDAPKMTSVAKDQSAELESKDSHIKELEQQLETLQERLKTAETLCSTAGKAGAERELLEKVIQLEKDKSELEDSKMKIKMVLNKTSAEVA